MDFILRLGCKDLFVCPRIYLRPYPYDYGQAADHTMNIAPRPAILTGATQI